MLTIREAFRYSFWDLPMLRTLYLIGLTLQIPPTALEFVSVHDLEENEKLGFGVLNGVPLSLDQNQYIRPGFFPFRV